MLVKYPSYLFKNHVAQGDMCDKAAIEDVFDQHRYETEPDLVHLH